MTLERQLTRLAYELIEDVEAVGEEQVKKDWPDLYATYRKARHLLGHGDLEWKG